MKPAYRTIAGLSSIGVLLAAGCGHKPTAIETKTLPPAAVQTQVVEAKNRTATEEVVGTVRAKLRAVIEAKVSGRIEKFLAVPGQEVKAGELLATIDAREVQARYDQAVAIRQQAESDLKRLSTLREQNVLSQAEFESAEARARVAIASVVEAETMLGYTKVTAPFNGVITRKHADVGDLAVPGKPLLEMEDSSHLRLEADVPEAVVGHLKLGDKLPVRIDALGKNCEGQISEIAPTADPNSRTFLVKLDLPNIAGMRAGQFGRVAAPVGETQTLRVPAAAVLHRGQLEIVFVANNGKAQMRLVKTGKNIGSETEVVSGLNAGETIVVSELANLIDGQPLTVTP